MGFVAAILTLTLLAVSTSSLSTAKKECWRPQCTSRNMVCRIQIGASPTGPDGCPTYTCVTKKMKVGRDGEMCPEVCPYISNVCPAVYDANGCEVEHEDVYVRPPEECPKSRYDENGCKVANCGADKIVCGDEGDPKSCPDKWCIPKVLASVTGFRCRLKCGRVDPPGLMRCEKDYDWRGCAKEAKFRKRADQCPKPQRDPRGCEILPPTACGQNEKECPMGKGLDVRGCSLGSVCVPEDKCCPTPTMESGMNDAAAPGGGN